MLGLHSQVVDLYFGPNGLIIWDPRRTQLISVDYSEIKMEYRTRYSSTSGIPPVDSPVVSQRWQHERVNGGPDLRFKYNPSSSVFRLGAIALTIEGVTFEVVLSSPTAAEYVHRYLVCVHEGLRTGVVPKVEFPKSAAAPKPSAPSPAPGPAPKAPSEKARKPRAKPAPARQPPPPPVGDTPLQRKERAISLFALVGEWTEKDLVSAYRRMAKEYHPDIHANLPPEFRELAHRKMSEITEAYHFLSSLNPGKGTTA